MNRPLRENLEVVARAGKEDICCTRCSYTFGPVGSDWRKKANRRLLPPTDAGPYREEMVDLFKMEQRNCPSCGVLLEVQMIEAES